MKSYCRTNDEEVISGLQQVLFKNKIMRAEVIKMMIYLESLKHIDEHF